MKQEPRYNCQKQYESKFKNNYKSMLVNMGKALMSVVNSQTKQKKVG